MAIGYGEMPQILLASAAVRANHDLNTRYNTVDFNREFQVRAIFLLVFGIVFLSWCKWTEPGELFVAKLSEKMGGAPTAELDFNALRGGLTEDEVRMLHPDLDWLCTEDLLDNKEEFTQRVCDAAVSYVNGVGAIRIDYLFREGKLVALIVEYRPDSFPKLLRKMDKTYSRAKDTDYFKSIDLELNTPEAFRSVVRSGEAKDYWGWDTHEGIVITSEINKNNRGNVIAFWASDNYIEKKMQGRRIDWRP